MALACSLKGSSENPSMLIWLGKSLWEVFRPHRRYPKELKCINDAGKGRNLCETKTDWLSSIDIPFKEVQ